MTVDQQFNVINEKLQLLMRQYSRVVKENEKLKDDLLQASAREAQTQSRIDSLSEQLSILKITNGDANDSTKKEFEKKINQYIREIDRCIAYLSA